MLRWLFLFLTLIGAARADEMNPAIPLQHHGYVSGNWYSPFYSGAPDTTGLAQVASTVYCVAGIIQKTVTIQGLGDYFSTGATATVSFAIYTDNNGAPGTLIDYSGYVNPSTGVFGSAAMHNTTDTLQPGPYWFCDTQNDATATMTSFNNTFSQMGSLIGSATGSQVSNTSSQIIGISCASSACGGGTAWGGSGTSGTYSWSSNTFSSYARSNWTNLTSAFAPFIVFQVN